MASNPGALGVSAVPDRDLPRAEALNVSGPMGQWMTMTQPQLAHQTASGRMYARSLDGLPEVPSITTVIGQQSVDLDGWIGHMAATAVVELSLIHI